MGVSRMFKKLLLSLLIIAGVGAASVSATQALFQDTAVLAENTFSTGTADLQVATSPVTDYADSKAGFTNTSLLPGQTVTFPFRLRNNSSDVEFSIQAQATITGTNTLPADKIHLTFTAVDSSGDPISTPVTDTLDNWTSVKALGDPIIDDGEFQRYEMDVMVDETITDQNASVSFDLTFTGTQVTPTPTPTP
jgi:hypothetical protein